MYNRALPDLTIDEIIRFNSYRLIKGNDDCWIWIAGRLPDCYGTFSYRNETYLANRIAYKIHYGQDPGEYQVCHKCDNPRFLERPMAKLRIKGDKAYFSVLNQECLGKACLVPGHYQVRGGTMSGLRNTGQTDPCCMTRAYHGCPDEKYNPELAQQRRSNGYKIT